MSTTLLLLVASLAMAAIVAVAMLSARAGPNANAIFDILVSSSLA